MRLRGSSMRLRAGKFGGRPTPRRRKINPGHPPEVQNSGINIIHKFCNKNGLRLAII